MNTISINSQACFCPGVLMGATFGSSPFIPGPPVLPEAPRDCCARQHTDMEVVPASKALESRLNFDHKYLWP